MFTCDQMLNVYHQYIKEYKVGHGAKKRDHFARTVFVLIMGEGIDDDHNFVNPLIHNFVDLGGGGD